MPDDHHDEPAKRSRIGVLLVMVLIVYLLGVVPANRFYLSTTNETARSTLEAIYYPLRWTAEHCPPFNSAIAWFMNLFD